jgi:hypothetical protein
LQQDKELTPQNTSIGIVGPPAPSEASAGARSHAFRILEGDQIEVFLARLPAKEVPAPAAALAADDGAEDVEML